MIFVGIQQTSTVTQPVNITLNNPPIPAPTQRATKLGISVEYLVKKNPDIETHHIIDNPFLNNPKCLAIRKASFSEKEILSKLHGIYRIT